MTDLDDLVAGPAGSWLLAVAQRDLARRSRDGLAWPAFARAVIDALAAAAELPVPRDVSAIGQVPAMLRPVRVGSEASTLTAAGEVGLSDRTVRRMCKTGKVISRRVGARTYLVDMDSLRNVLGRRPT